MAEDLLARRLNRRRVLQAGAVGATVPAMIAREGARAAGVRAQDAPTGVLQMGRASEVAPVWSPLKASTGVHAQVFDLVFNRLAKFDANLQLIPDLAEEFEVSPDATVFTFRLRQDVMWHDGQPFTARDVMFTYKLALTQEAGARQYGKLSEIKGAPAFYEGTADDVPGLQMPDDYTFIITLEKPDVAFFIGTSHSNAMLWIVPEHILRDMNPAEIEQHPFTQKPDVGTGPYRFIDYVPDQYLEFAANTSYFKGSPKIEKVFVRLAEPATALAQLESGELHVMGKITPKDAERLQTNQLLTISPQPGVGVFQTAIFNEKFPDKRFRQALMYGVNRAALIDVVLRGQGRLVYSTVIGPEWAIFDDLNPYDYNPEMAKQLLTESGWDTSQKVVLNWPKGFQDIELAAPVFQQQLAEVGLQIELEPLDTPAFVKKVVEEPDFELAWFSGGVYGMDPDVSAVYYTCSNFTPQGANTTHYCNAELDALFVEGRGTSDIAQRTEIYHTVARTLNEDIPTIFWWSENIIWGINKQVQGIQPGPNPDIQWNIHEWSLTA
jgi:peptide/nickel transport system substrate-binding protein